MDRNKQVGALLVGNRGPSFQRDERIILPRVGATSAPSRVSSSLPSRRPTSSTRSFSCRPSGPIVPVSWPPCPGSITILPIFSPKARISDRSPLAVGRASRTSRSLDFRPAVTRAEDFTCGWLGACVWGAGGASSSSLSTTTLVGAGVSRVASTCLGRSGKCRFVPVDLGTIWASSPTSARVTGAFPASARSSSFLCAAFCVGVGIGTASLGVSKSSAIGFEEPPFGGASTSAVVAAASLGSFPCAVFPVFLPLFLP